MFEPPPAAVCERFEQQLTMFDLVTLAHREARHDLAVIASQRPSAWWSGAGFVLVVVGLVLTCMGSGGLAAPLMGGDFVLAIVYIARECLWEKRIDRAQAEVDALSARLQSL